MSEAYRTSLNGASPGSTVSLPDSTAGSSPFVDSSTATPARPEPPQRPRLLSYVARWGRARRWLPEDARHVLDVGSAFGYGTAAVAGGGRNRRQVIGVERDAVHIAAAAKNFAWLPLMRADATNLPVRDGSVDAVILLDVLEHVADPRGVLLEAHRVMREGGHLIVSLPHKGLLEPLDSLNVYPALRRRFPSWPPLESADDVDSGRHQHFSLEDLKELLGDGFVVERVARTGLGAAELVHLAILLTCKAALRSPGLYRGLLFLHLLTYIADDLLPTGRFAYYLTIQARAVAKDPKLNQPGSAWATGAPGTSGIGGS